MPSWNRRCPASNVAFAKGESRNGGRVRAIDRDRAPVPEGDRPRAALGKGRCGDDRVVEVRSEIPIVRRGRVPRDEDDRGGGSPLLTRELLVDEPLGLRRFRVRREGGVLRERDDVPGTPNLVREDRPQEDQDPEADERLMPPVDEARDGPEESVALLRGAPHRPLPAVRKMRLHKRLPRVVSFLKMEGRMGSTGFEPVTFTVSG